jgi:hypothetical protein
MLLYSLLLTDTLTLLSLQDNKRIKSLGFKYVSVFVKKVNLEPCKKEESMPLNCIVLVSNVGIVVMPGLNYLF